MSIRSLLAALTLVASGTAQAQGYAATSDAAAPAIGTPPGNEAINPTGNAPSSVNASGTVQTVPMSDLARGANSFTENQARARIAGAGFAGVTALAKDQDGIWRGHGDRGGRTFAVGFDFKGQVAFQ